MFGSGVTARVPITACTTVKLLLSVELLSILSFLKVELRLNNRKMVNNLGLWFTKELKHGIT